MNLVQTGKIDLDQPIGMYLTRWSTSEFDHDIVIVRGLLCHMSGLEDGLGYGDYEPDEALPSLEAPLQHPRASSGRDVQIKLGRAPGNEWDYSGGGYLILQLIIEEVSGQPFADYMQTALFDPVAMSRSTYKYIGTIRNSSNSYDANGQPVTSYQYAASAATGFSTSLANMAQPVHAYDAKGRLGTLTIAGQAIPYMYNADDELTQAGQQTSTYDGQGLLVSTTLDTINETFTYNSFAELTGHTVTTGATTLYDAQYTRDQLGRITQLIETIAGTILTIDYSYDLAGRLSTLSQDGALTNTYTYDSNGNRTDNGATYDAQDRIISQAGMTYNHNAQGERISTTEGANTNLYQYDAQGSLIGATSPNGDQVDYLLDGQSRRSVKQVNGATTEAWLYGDALNPVAQLDATNAVSQRYIYSNRTNIPAYLEAGASTYKLIADHLGSVRLVVDAATGALAQRLDYDAWGAITADSNPGFQPFAYAGGKQDTDTILTHFGLREYDPQTASWTSKDPIGFDGSGNNLYAYVAVEPINRIDPTALENEGCDLLGGPDCTIGPAALPAQPDIYTSKIGEWGVRLPLNAYATSTMLEGALGRATFTAIGYGGLAATGMGLLGSTIISVVPVALGTAIGHQIAPRAYPAADAVGRKSFFVPDTDTRSKAMSCREASRGAAIGPGGAPTIGPRPGPRIAPRTR